MTISVPNKHGWRLLAGLLALLNCALAWSVELNEYSRGEAFDLSSGELIYREIHCKNDAGLVHEVHYEHADGQPLADKKLDYSSGKITPSFVQHNILPEGRIEVSLSGTNLTISTTAGDQSNSVKINLGGANKDMPLVIDAGFDPYIRENWARLLSDNTQQFQFPAVTRSSLVELQIRRLGCSYDTNEDQCFRLEMANWLYRVLVAPIELGYDKKLKRLKRYRGLSNIEDKNGKGLIVDIRYSYPETGTKACDTQPQALSAN